MNKVLKIMNHSMTLKFVTVIVGLSFTVCSSSLTANDTKKHRIDNLDYGQALFSLYQKKYFSALTELNILHNNQVDHKQGNLPSLIYSGLALEYGLVKRTQVKLDTLSSKQLSDDEHDQVWFYKAQLAMRIGDYAQAEKLINKIGDELPTRFMHERDSMKIANYIRLGNLQKAQDALGDVSDDNQIYLYDKYNLGVIQFKSGDTETGIENLAEIGTLQLESASTDILALKDKANLALGFAFLKQNRPKLAIQYFTRIRLKGPLSNKALLGLGWAYVLTENYKKALTPWLELKSRHTIDLAVQEVLTAIPHTLEKLENPRAAAAQYEDALKSYRREAKRLQATLHSIDSGKFIKSLQPSNIDDNSDWPWKLTIFPDTEAAPYLAQLFATHEFQSGFDNYRTLLYLDFKLQYWLDTLPTYQQVLVLRKNSYQQHLKDINLDSHIQQLDTIKNKYTAMTKQLQTIETNKDSLALADSFETKLLQQLNDINDKIVSTQTDENTKLMQQTHRLSGLLRWDIERDYAPRLWQSKLTLQQLAESLQQTTAIKNRVTKSRRNATDYFKIYQARINNAEKRLQDLSKKLKTALQQQKQQLQILASRELTHRQTLLFGYIDQSQFSLARLYDEIANEQLKQQELAK